ncbi:MAG TPA: ArsR family transcriptional regulator [Candidatus Caldiarchaeum subterraneum]|uniref:ArsR family transcriptional regulator n=1 Tax=Caldiarchaeum subterraneum TaxID=311458 RepID=A0A832ZVF3_CALS0|nr:ArsR family transcriptional regulator [Candidatus Caldarchaeum subterraneum]
MEEIKNETGINILRILARPVCLEILLNLRKSELSIFELTKILNTKEDEIRRNLELLIRNGLVQRTADKNYTLTNLSYLITDLAEIMLKCVELSTYLNYHKTYFTNEYTLLLLEKGNVVTNIWESIEITEQIITSARDELYLAIEGIGDLISNLDLNHIQNIKIILSQSEKPYLTKLQHKGIQTRIFNEQPYYNLAANQDEAIIFMRKTNGKIDYNTAVSGSGVFHDICIQLFEKLWRSSRIVYETILEVGSSE